MPKKEMHPNSLANLTRTWDSDSAREAQLLGAKKRTENAKKRNEIREILKMMKSMKDELQEDKMDSVDMLRLMAYQKLEEGDSDAAIDIFTRIAEFEKPKLQRVEQKVESTKVDQLTDEELNKLLKKAAEESQ